MYDGTRYTQLICNILVVNTAFRVLSASRPDASVKQNALAIMAGDHPQCYHSPSMKLFVSRSEPAAALSAEQAPVSFFIVPLLLHRLHQTLLDLAQYFFLTFLQLARTRNFRQRRRTTKRILSGLNTIQLIYRLYIYTCAVGNLSL